MRKDLQQLFDEFIFECEYVRKLKPRTLKGYRDAFRLFIKLVPDPDMVLIRPVTIAQFFKTLEHRKRIVGKGKVKTGIKRSTVATYWSKLNSFFRWLQVKGYIKQTPFQGMRYPTPLYEDKRFLKKEAVEKVLTAILLHSGNNSLLLKRNLAIFHIFLFCGLRKEELLSLQVRDIDWDRRMLTIRKETSKSARGRYIPLHSRILAYLKDYMNERTGYTTSYLFVSRRKDDRLTHEGMKHLVEKLKAYSGIHFHLHQLRHTFAVNFLKSSNNIVKLKQLLGHTSIAMTAMYVRCLPPHEMRQDIEGMSIDDMV